MLLVFQTMMFINLDADINNYNANKKADKTKNRLSTIGNAHFYITLK